MASRARRVFWWLMISTLFPYSALAAKLQDQTLRAWEQYQRLTEARIRREIESTEGFLVRDFFAESEAAVVRKALENGNVFIKPMKTQNEEGGEVEIPKGIVHHWYGSVFVPGATVDEVLAWEQDYDNHENYFDEVEDSRLDSHRDDTFEIFLRLRRKKVIIVHYNTEHRVTYESFGDGAVASRSESTRIAEIENPGTEREREKPVGNDRGFLWRLNSYWRFLQAPEGVIVECESISLSRAIPKAIAWMVNAIAGSVPRESLEATLQPLRDAFVPETGTQSSRVCPRHGGGRTVANEISSWTRMVPSPTRTELPPTATSVIVSPSVTTRMWTRLGRPILTPCRLTMW